MNISNFLKFSLRNLLSQKFIKTLNLAENFGIIDTHVYPQYQFFIFHLKLCKGVSSLHSL